MHGFQRAGRAVGLQVVGLDPAGIHAHAVRDPAVRERLEERLVGIAQPGVLADHRDRHLAFRRQRVLDNPLPAGEIGRRRIGDAEIAHDLGVEALRVVAERHLVDGLHVGRGDHVVFAHVAELRDLRALGLGDRAVRPAEQQIGRDADATQLLYRMLGGLGLQLAGGVDVGHQGQVDEHHLVPPVLVGELADRFEEGQALDIAHRAADLDQHEVGAVAVADDRLLDRVGNVGDDLHGAAEVVAAPLLRDHGLIDLARGDAVRAPCGHAGEALVVPEVEVGLGAVVGDVDLAVLKGAHGARVDVEVGVELAQPNPIAPRLKERAERRRGQALAEGGHHAAGDEDVPRHGPLLYQTRPSRHHPHADYLVRPHRPRHGGCGAMT